MPHPHTHWGNGRLVAQARPSPWTTSSGRLKGLGLSHHQCRVSFLFAGMGAYCYGDRRCPLQVADTRPSHSPGLPLSLQLLRKQLGWQNHLFCDQRGRGQALPGDLGKAPLISPSPGNFPVKTPGALWGRRDRPEGVGTDTSWEWQEGLETYQERGLRLRTGRSGSPYGSLFPLPPCLASSAAKWWL